MSDYKNLNNGILYIAWGYFFIYFNLNINNVSILPSFIGYLLFLSAINLLKYEERELELLRPLGVIMALWTSVEWLFAFSGLKFERVWHLIDIIICVINLYFHFQLLTNLSSIAAKYQTEGYELDKKLHRYRTMQTVMLTVIEVVSYFYEWLSDISAIIAVCMMVVYFIAGICMMKALFDLSGCISKR